MRRPSAPRPSVQAGKALVVQPRGGASGPVCRSQAQHESRGRERTIRAFAAVLEQSCLASFVYFKRPIFLSWEFNPRQPQAGVACVGTTWSPERRGPAGRGDMGLHDPRCALPGSVGVPLTGARAAFLGSSKLSRLAVAPLVSL